MDRDSIKEFLEVRYKELAKEEILPTLKKKVEVEDAVVATEKKKINLKKASYYAFVVLVLGGLVFFGYEVYQRWSLKQADQIEVLLMRLEVLTDLPENEVPTIATVTNANMVRNQLFFKEAMNGDKVVIYRVAKKAILYRPSTGKIVAIALIN